MKASITTLTICLLLTVTKSNAQWQETSLRTDVNSSYWITKLYYDNDIFWAGSRSRVYKSEDKGKSWSEVTSGGINVTQTDVKDIIKLGDYVYVAFGGNGNKQIYRTNNAGQTWSLDTAGHTPFQHVTNFYTHQDYVVAKLETNFVLYKKNADAQWTTLSVPESRFNTPATIFSKGDTLILTSGQPAPAMALTTDMGQNWTVRATDWGPVLPANGDWTFGVWHGKHNKQQMFGTHRGFTTTTPLKYIYHFINTYDGMETFDTVSFNSSGLVTMWLHNDDVYAGFQRSNSELANRIMHSADKGQSWTDITGNMLDFVQFNHLPVSSVEVIDGVVFVAGNQDGVLSHGNAVSIDKRDSEALGITVYPNPAQRVIAIAGATPGTRMEIRNSLGQVQFHSTLQQANAYIDVSALGSGLYIINFTTKDGKTANTKFVKE